VLVEVTLLQLLEDVLVLDSDPDSEEGGSLPLRRSVQILRPVVNSLVLLEAAQEYLSQVLHQVDDMSLCHCFVLVEAELVSLNFADDAAEFRIEMIFNRIVRPSGQHF